MFASCVVLYVCVCVMRMEPWVFSFCRNMNVWAAADNAEPDLTSCRATKLAAKCENIK